MRITIDIPDNVLHASGLSNTELQADVTKEFAIALYARGALSLGKAVEVAQIARADFEDILAARHIERPYDITELERDLAWARRTD